jgi:hypothetical protein
MSFENHVVLVPLSLIYFMMPSTNHHVMKTPAELEEGAQQNELQYTKDVHNMMKNPKERHLRDEFKVGKNVRVQSAKEWRGLESV